MTMTIHETNKMHVSEYFSSHPLPDGWEWIVYTTSSRYHGYTISSRLVLYCGKKPNNSVIAEKNGCPVERLPIHPGISSPKTIRACARAVADIRDKQLAMLLPIVEPWAHKCADSRPPLTDEHWEILFRKEK